MEEIKGRGIVGIFHEISPSPMAIYKDLYHVYLKNTCSLHYPLCVCKIIIDQSPKQCNFMVRWSELYLPVAKENVSSIAQQHMCWDYVLLFM